MDYKHKIGSMSIIAHGDHEFCRRGVTFGTETNGHEATKGESLASYGAYLMIEIPQIIVTLVKKTLLSSDRNASY
nr:hypothetical protein [Tanacetum cinerariifolium]